MKSTEGIGLNDVQAVYAGPEGDLWELVMGHQIHIGGLNSTMALAERAGIGKGMRGIDLCCCNGAGMRALVRFLNVASMHGVDTTERMVARGRERCEAEGLEDRITFTVADACHSGLPGGEADFVWGEDAWCYVENKERLICEAARLARKGGVIAFTDWVEGPAGLTRAEAERLLRFMKFPNIQDVDGYGGLLEANGCKVLAAEDTEQFSPYADLYMNMLHMQLTYDALRIIGYDLERMKALSGEMAFMQGLAHEGKIAQARFVARKK